jgi:hypothetical protein
MTRLKPEENIGVTLTPGFHMSRNSPPRPLWCVIPRPSTLWFRRLSRRVS